jgi:hypothetical protein
MRASLPAFSSHKFDLLTLVFAGVSLRLSALETDPITDRDPRDSATLMRRGRYEQITAAIIRFDKSKTTFRFECDDCAGLAHQAASSCTRIVATSILPGFALLGRTVNSTHKTWPLR